MSGRSLDEFGSPLFLAWQLTNRCEANCLACCEESGPDKGWKDELNRDEALHVAEQAIGMGIPYVAFGGGEPLSVPFCWDIFEKLAAAGITLKLETNGRHIDDAAADRLQAMQVQCVQISVDGSTAEVHERVRPGSSFDAALAAIDRLVSRGLAPQVVFSPTRLNVDDMAATYELAKQHGCSAFVTGPLMQLGRAAWAWDTLACDEETWRDAAMTLRARAIALGGGLMLSIYPWGILTELDKRIESPQAMMLVVPNGRVKLLNALPFAPGDLRRMTLAEAWDAYRQAWKTDEVRDFIARCQADPNLLRHANETWYLRETV
ncbi:radical SAM protein [Rhodopila globiformis]|uniref:Radical SAM core domain-containing protein n=1 Tax=Rhodopila globiformis TaxID=1071 RepID=A0A2S6N4P0_RHOGL|nr:radical SAM protein [Rhodopila globiformis]PPQ29593.1 hypothetical protein CCS01_21280 [Rhodopila globiformis]